ncbi:hypothetical protein Taro_023397 [Colocasia esculenta]|uniref:Uncharacterized protein n=1 Tax=Colocasia esculenta TaxID=4460 RepID=A0A843VED0_COLES|nr:hypothetical protein [Colocasia esculenta]
MYGREFEVSSRAMRKHNISFLVDYCVGTTFKHFVDHKWAKPIGYEFALGSGGHDVFLLDHDKISLFESSFFH